MIDYLSPAIALLAALYARYSYSQAKKANQLVFHSIIKPIFTSFEDLRIHMDNNGRYADKETVQRFLPYKRDAEIYFDKKTYNLVSEYYSACFHIADMKLSRTNNKLTQEQISQLDKKEKLYKTYTPIIQKRIRKKLTVRL